MTINRETFLHLTYPENHLIPDECMEVYKDLFEYERCTKDSLDDFIAWRKWWAGDDKKKLSTFDKAAFLLNVYGFKRIHDERSVRQVIRYVKFVD